MEKRLFRLLLLSQLITFAIPPLRAQGTEPGSVGRLSPDCFMTDQGTFTAVKRSAALDNRHSGCTVWHLYWTAVNVATISLEADSAADSAGSPGTWAAWPAGGIASGPNPQTTGTSGFIDFAGFQPWVSVNVATLTASSGTPQVDWVLMGWKSALGSTGTGILPSALNTFATINAVATSAAFAVPSYLRNHSVQVSLTSGSVTTCTVNLDGSLDGTNWFDISGSQNCASAGGILFHVSEKPVAYVRINVTALTGTNPVLTPIYLGVR